MFSEILPEQELPKNDSTIKAKLIPEIFYTSEEYLRIQELSNPINYTLSDNNHRGKIQFFEINQELVSGHKAPFGSFVFSKDIDREFAERFINQIANINRPLRINHYPEIYGGEWIPEKLISTQKFSVKTELNHHIDLRTPIPKFHNMQIRRIRKCESMGLIISKVESDYSEVYDFLKKCREEQNLKINISLKSFLNCFTTKDRYELFVVENQSKIVSATLMVKVNDDIVYNYLPASSKESSHYSPMTFLMNYLIGHYKSNGFKFLDWGKTSIDGIEQTSLAQFKERMGAIRTKKHTFIK